MVNEDVTWRFSAILVGMNPIPISWNGTICSPPSSKDQPYNEVRRGAEASLVTCMGRMAAHTGQIVTRDQMLNHDHELAPQIELMTFDSPAPVLADADGKYPVPQPGVVQRRREY